MTSAGGPLLVLERVERSFGTSGPPALAGVDLVIHRGEFLCILGASGSGKSTLLNILGCLDRPSGGRVLINGEDVWSQSPDRIDALRRQSFGFIFQRYALIASLDVAQNVELPGLYARLSADERAGRVRTLLARFGLADKARQRPNLLSGGEQQRVAIALALANQPHLLLADEPTGSIDTRTAGIILEIFREINRHYGTTIVIVTHDPQMARAVDRFVHIRDGKISTEAIRRVEMVETDEGQQERTVHEEHTVLDSAGRLQIPPELLAEVGLRDRVRLVVHEGRIVLEPIEPQRSKTAPGR